MIKVSILLPTYNGSRYIGDTLQSLLQQTHTNIEIVVVDDCSTDDTCAIVETLADSRIRLIRHAQNCGGPSAGINTAMQHASGDLIALMDHDDLWSPTKLARQVRLFQQLPSLGGCFTDYRKFGVGDILETGFDERQQAMRRYPRQALGEDAYVITSSSFLLDITRIQATPMNSTMMFRSTVLRKIMPLSEDISHQDVQITFRLANQTQFAYVDQPLMQRRLHPQNWGNMMGSVCWLKSHVDTLEQLEQWTTLNRSERSAVRQLLSGYLSAVAYTLFTSQKPGEARGYYAKCLAIRFQPKWLFYWLACWMPAGVLHLLRTLKQRSGL